MRSGADFTIAPGERVAFVMRHGRVAFAAAGCELDADRSPGASLKNIGPNGPGAWQL